LRFLLKSAVIVALLGLDFCMGLYETGVFLLSSLSVASLRRCMAYSWPIAGCHQRRDATVPRAGPADRRHLPYRLSNSYIGLRTDP